jgi:hypothetical protein
VLPGFEGRSKLFFMFNWEGLRERKSLTATPSLPLSAWRNGDFSQLRDASGNLIPIYDPATRVFDAAGNVLQAPTPFPGNVIPAGRIHPVSRGLMAFYPAPDDERTGPNFTNHEARRVDADQFTYRLDFVEGVKSSWFFRHSFSRELGYDPFAIPNMGINTDTDVNQAVLANTRMFGSNKLNDLRFGYGKLDNAHISPRANNVNVVRDLGINLPTDNPLYWGVPNIGITGLSGLGEESDAPFINHDTTFQVVDNFCWSVGQHSIKFGGELRRVLYDQIGGVVTRGRWAFDGRYTGNPLVPVASRGGAPFADFLLGHFNRSEGQVGAPIANFRSGYYALYAQDSWKARPNLTVNYGIRWEYDQPIYDKNDNIVNIDFKWDNSALANQYDEPSSYITQWSLGMQRELPGAMSGEVTYFGSAGVHLRRLMSYNNPEPSQLANSNLARPFPKFGSIQVMSAPGHSSYHALYLKVQRRFSQGVSFLSSFSYSKSIDNGAAASARRMATP